MSRFKCTLLAIVGLAMAGSAMAQVCPYPCDSTQVSFKDGDILSAKNITFTTNGQKEYGVILTAKAGPGERLDVNSKYGVVKLASGTSAILLGVTVKELYNDTTATVDDHHGAKGMDDESGLVENKPFVSKAAT